MLLERALRQPEHDGSGSCLSLRVSSMGLKVTAKSLPGEYDDNFHLMPLSEVAGAQPRVAVPLANSFHTDNEAGVAGFVLKVMHPARERAFIDMQCRALQHLARRVPQLTLPRLRLNRHGEAFTEITAADGTRRLAWLLTYVPGTMLVKARPHSPELLQSLGRFLGEMDAALTDFSHPAAQRDLKWDFVRAGWIRAASASLTRSVTARSH